MNTKTQQTTTSYKAVKQLLSEGTTNTKTAKNEIKTYILYLAPSDIIGTHNLCPFASEGCKKSCLYSAGRGKFSNVQQSRINKAKFWAYDREAFYTQLADEILLINSKAIKHDYKVAIRLNGTSDIDHLSLLLKFTGIDFLTYDNLLFYDYTKNPNTIRKYINSRYKLTFSLSEDNFDDASDILRNGGSVAMVFASTPPKFYLNYPVIDGDISDLRYYDPKNVIVGLKAKGEAKKDKSGFVIR